MTNQAALAEKYDLEKLNHQLDWVKSQIFLGSNAAFMAPILSGLDFMWIDQGTAATDGKRFYWNPEDFIKCTKNDKIATVPHELHHVGRLHILRGKGLDPKIWNYACDIVINRDLRKDGFILETPGMWIEDHPEIPFFVEEDIYQYLVANKQKYPQMQQMPSHFGSAIPGAPGTDEAGNAITPPSDMEMVNLTIRAVHSAKMADQAGSIPGHVEQYVEQFLAPIVDWEAEFMRFFTDLLDEEYTMARPNRRYLSDDIYLSSRFQDDGRLAHLIWYMDVSGSVSNEDILRFSSEVKYVWEYFKPQKLTIVQFDTRITSELVFKDDDDFEKIKILGRGGTDLLPVRDHIEKNQPTAAIIFSDLYVSPMQPLTNDIPTIWISTTKVKGAFGRTVHIKV